MKKILSKNTVIVFLVATNLSLAAYVLNDKFKFGFASANAAVKKQAIVEPVNFFKNDNELQVCYEDFLSHLPAVDEGALIFHLKFSQTGKVDFLELVHSDLDDEDFTSCIFEKIQAKKYPVTRDRVGVMIAQKLNFHKKALSNINFDR